MHAHPDAGPPQMKVSPGEFKVWRVGFYNDDCYYSPSYGIDFRTKLQLKSSEQPHGCALACTDHQLLYQYNTHYLELAQFQAVPGDLGDLP
jgi:hypothetical protein